MPKRVGYARTAVDDPDITLQLADLALADCARVFEDRTLADTQPASGWMACLASLKRDDILVISRLERLAFTLEQLGDALRDLVARGVQLHVCHCGPPSNLELGTLAELVQRLTTFERAGRRELIHAGMIEARSKGRVGGRRHKLTTDQVTELRQLMAQPDADPVAVGERFGVSRASVYKYAKP
jgi:DNA invertase Pin-like site-specific DNA recombinase